MENATSDAISSEPTPAPAMKKISSSPACRPKMVALALRTPYDSPCDIDSTAPEPGEMAMMQAATTNVIHVVKLMLALLAKSYRPHQMMSGRHIVTGRRRAGRESERRAGRPTGRCPGRCTRRRTGRRSGASAGRYTAAPARRAAAVAAGVRLAIFPSPPRPCPPTATAHRPPRSHADMAGTSLLALLDDIASILDDVALMSKIAARKTAGVLGDDLALNAQQMAGMRAERELPVVWAVARGSLKNKPLLMAGGAYLCYEGVEKLAHPLLHGDGPDAGRQHGATAETAPATTIADADPEQIERDKIRGAVRTDFVLSSEIIVIALGTVAGAPFAQQLVVLAGIAVVMTVGVYGIVAAIVKLDDAGLYLSRRGGAAVRAIGGVLLTAAPRLMALLSVVGTIAMFTVGGGILVHGLPAVAALIEAAAHAGAATPWAGALLAGAIPVALEALAGVVAGALVLALVGIASWALRFTKGRS